MSENPNEIFGAGVTINGRSITWFRAVEPGVAPTYALTDDRSFEDES